METLANLHWRDELVLGKIKRPRTTTMSCRLVAHPDVVTTGRDEFLETRHWHAVVASVMDLPIAHNSMDCIILDHILDCWPYRARINLRAGAPVLISNIKRALRPGGTMALTFRNRWCRDNFRFLKRHGYRGDSEITRFRQTLSLRRCMRILKQAGFNDIQLYCLFSDASSVKCIVSMNERTLDLYYHRVSSTFLSKVALKVLGPMILSRLESSYLVLARA